MNKTEVVRAYMSLNKDEFISIGEISRSICLKYHSVKKIIAKAYKIGWVYRTQLLLHTNGFNKGLPVYKTAYQIIKVDSWLGLHDYYEIAIAKQQGINISFQETLMRQPGVTIKDLIACKKKINAPYNLEYHKRTDKQRL